MKTDISRCYTMVCLFFYYNSSKILSHSPVFGLTAHHIHKTVRLLIIAGNGNGGGRFFINGYDKTQIFIEAFQALQGFL